MKVSSNGNVGKVEIAAYGNDLVSLSGTALLAEVSDRLGLTGALSRALADTRERRGDHDVGRVLRDPGLALTAAEPLDLRPLTYLGRRRSRGSPRGLHMSRAQGARGVEPDLGS